MSSLNTTRLLNGTTVNGQESARIFVQATREEQVGFFVFISPFGGSTMTIRGAPDVQAASLTAPVEGMTLWTVITTGTAAAGQTKVNGAGHALVFLPALPIMFVRFQNALSPSDACWCWLVE